MTAALHEDDSPLDTPLPRERTVPELFSELASEIGQLVRQEIKLASTELTQRATYAGVQIACIGAGALLATVGLLSLVSALVLVLATVMDLWLAALLVGLFLAVVAALLVWKGVASLQQLDLAPRQTIQTLREDRTWLQQQVR